MYQKCLTSSLNQQAILTLNDVNFTIPADIWVSDPVSTSQTFTLRLSLKNKAMSNEKVQSDRDTSVSFGTVCLCASRTGVLRVLKLSGFPQETSLCPSAGRELQEYRIQRHYGICLGAHAMVSFPGSLLSLKVCMFITSSVFTMAGGWTFCFRLRWHFIDTLSSSTIALQNDRCTSIHNTIIYCT